MKTNNKGFTFVEILAAIVIIGILMSISIVGVSKYKEKAKNKDYEALAKASYNATEEYIMSHPYENKVSLETLEEERLISNRKDPGDTEKDCTGTVSVDKEAGEDGKIDDGVYTVNLCCPSHKKTYTYPDGSVTNLTDTSECDYVAPEPSPQPDPTPEPDPTPTPQPEPTPTPEQKYTCEAGKYLPANKTTCATCTPSNYCPGGTFPKKNVNQGINPCPNGYKNSPAGSSKITQCYINVSAGKRIATAKSTTMTPCGKGTFKAAHKVNYGSTSTCTNCPSGYRDGAGTTAQTNCIMNVSKDHYVKKSKDSKATSCPNKYIRKAHSVKYTKTSECVKYNPVIHGGIYLDCEKDGKTWPGDCDRQFLPRYTDTTDKKWRYDVIYYGDTDKVSWFIKMRNDKQDSYVKIKGNLKISHTGGRTYCFTVYTDKTKKIKLVNKYCQHVPKGKVFDSVELKW